MGLAMENQGEQSILKMLAKWLSNALVASLFLTLMIIFVILVSGFLKSDWVGTWKPILDPQLIVSIWVAELPLAYFVKYILGERVDRPVLEILDLLDERTGQFGYDPTYYGITVWNKGATIAEDCDLSIDISGLQELSIAWQPTRNQPVDIRPDRKQKTEILRAVPLESISRYQMKEIGTLQENSHMRIIGVEYVSVLRTANQQNVNSRPNSTKITIE